MLFFSLSFQSSPHREPKSLSQSVELALVFGCTNQSGLCFTKFGCSTLYSSFAVSRRKTTLLGHVKIIFLNLCLITTLTPQSGNAEELQAFGLATLQPMTDSEGDVVRGLGLLAKQQGFSLISGTLLDPATGSTVRERAIEYTQVVSNQADDCCCTPEIDYVFAETSRAVSIDRELTIQDSDWFMNGSIVSTGYAYAERF
ncbi:MAG: hypothetical protein CMM01_14005 [Rhodopirellula sp.]|nr:hypothetical protein [Rhodopirellula sp.]